MTSTAEPVIAAFATRSMGSRLRLLVAEPATGAPAGWESTLTTLWTAVRAEFGATDLALSRYRSTSPLSGLNALAGSEWALFAAGRRLSIALELGATAREEGLPSVSIWGNVPHYISSTLNPRVSVAMLRQVANLLDLTLDLDDLERQADSFDSQVSQAIAQNPEVAEYVRRLESQEGGDGDAGRAPERPTPPDLPSSDALIKELEDFLKRGQTGEGGENR